MLEVDIAIEVGLASAVFGDNANDSFVDVVSFGVRHSERAGLFYVVKDVVNKTADRAALLQWGACYRNSGAVESSSGVLVSAGS
ncbi:MAG: hypothetical protein ACI9WS_000064 [Paraglaciecola psychrophila]